LREGKLKKMDFAGINKNVKHLDCKSCLKNFSISELQQEIDSRKKVEEKVNILVPRKKNK